MITKLLYLINQGETFTKVRFVVFVVGSDRTFLVNLASLKLTLVRRALNMLVF